MSASLIRRGLQLLAEDFKDVNKEKQQQKKKMKKKKSPNLTPSSSSVMDLVSSNRHGVTKQVKRLQGRLGPRKSKTTVKDKRIRSAVEELRRKQETKHLTNNLKYFMKTGVQTSDSDTMKIQNHNTGRQSRNRPIKAAPKTKKESCLFTEEQFQMFQEEYFGRMVEKK